MTYIKYWDESERHLLDVQDNKHTDTITDIGDMFHFDYIEALDIINDSEADIIVTLETGGLVTIIDNIVCSPGQRIYPLSVPILKISVQFSRILIRTTGKVTLDTFQRHYLVS